MSLKDVSGNQPDKMEISWAKECIIGALVSIAFTVMAMNAGTAGVEPDSIAEHLHNLLVIGGVSMAALCGTAAAVLVVLQIASSAVVAVRTIKPAKQFAAVRLMKIFMP